MTRTLSLFIAVALAGIAVLGAGLYARDGKVGLASALIAGAVCLVPTTLSLAASLWARSRSGSDQLMALMGGMAVRMAAVLGVSLVAFLKIPQFREDRGREMQYWSAVFVCYMGTLAWETFLTARGRKAAAPAQAAPAAPPGGG